MGEKVAATTYDILSLKDWEDVEVQSSYYITP